MEDADKGGVSLFRKEIPLPCTLPEKIHIAGGQLEELQCLPIALPARGGAAFEAAIRFASAPTTRCCAAVGGSAALRMRHTPCGCRSAHLVGVRSNLRLPRHYSMRRAQQCRYFARSLPPRERHTRLTVVRRGCKRSRLAGVHGEAMYTAPTLRSACSHSSARLPMQGVEGGAPRPSLGDLKGVFSSRREYPLCPTPHGRRGPHTAPAALQNSRTSVRCEKRSILWTIQ